MDSLDIEQKIIYDNDNLKIKDGVHFSWNTYFILTGLTFLCKACFLYKAKPSSDFHGEN